MLEIKKLTKTFNKDTPDEARALSNISLTVDESSFTVIIGTNGSGKSTLLNAVAGSFISDSGRIELDGKNITKWPEHKRAEFIGRVFQNPFSGTAANMTIAENLALAARRGKRRGLQPLLNKNLINDFYKTVSALNMGLEDRLSNLIGSLSGGQRQALTLLMAAYLTPKLLLLDEHTAALDPKSADKIIMLTNSIIKEKKITALMVTHSMHQAIRLGDRLIMMHKGEVVYDFKGKEKQRLSVNGLLDKFEEIKQTERLDETAAEMLAENYI